MRSKKYLRNNTFALSVMYDTLLFLSFISLSGVLVLPVFYQQTPFILSQHQAHEENVEESLHLLLTSSDQEFEYTTAGSLIDTIGETMGVNTTQKSGIYAQLTSWLLGKEQLHKTYGQILCENLVTQMNIPVSQNSTLTLNIFTQDFTDKLTDSIKDFLDTTLSQRYQYNFTASWHPIVSIPFGGSLSIGPPPPKVNQYTAQEHLSVPFLPVLTFGNQTIVFSEGGLTPFFSKLFLQNSTVLRNISDLLHLKNTTTGQFEDEENITHFLAQNLSSLFNSLLTTGFSVGSENTSIPGVLEWILAYFFSPFLDKLQYSTTQLLNLDEEYTFGSFASLFTSLNSSNNNVFDKIQEEIVRHISSSMGTSFLNISDAYAQLIYQVAWYVSTLLEDVFYPLMYPYAQQLMTIELATDSFLEYVLDVVFDQLSLTTATVTLTIWERAL